MKKIYKAETADEYDEQIDYLDDILSVLEDLQTLYSKDKLFADEYKNCENISSWIEDVQQDLKNEREELIQIEIKEHDKEIFEMNCEFERSRL
jgi:uncharacterized protein HemX